MRAQRFQRPLSLIMADLDLLRDINNTYGHLAGDAVLHGIADVFRAGAAPLRRAGALRRRGVLDPPARDLSRAGVRDRRPDPSRRGCAAVRGRDLERADPRHDLDGHRGVPPRRPRAERARPPGRPRRLPREAPGPEPRPRRVERAVARPAADEPRAARGRAGAGDRAGPAALAGARADPRGRAAAGDAPAHPARAALHLDAAAARRARRPRRRRSAPPPACSAAIFGSSQDVIGLVTIVVPRRRSARRSRSRWRRPARSPSAPSARSPRRRSSGRVPRSRSP